MRTLNHPCAAALIALIALAAAQFALADPGAGHPVPDAASADPVPGSLAAGAAGDALQARIDSLEVKVEKIIMDRVDANPYATGETLDWGTGWMSSVATGAKNQWTIEVGYMFGLPNWTPPWEREYIDQRRSYRLGVSAGFQRYRREALLHKDNGDLYYSQGVALALRLTWGTPVLLNFISGSAYVRGLWIHPDYDENDHGREKSLAGIGLGSDLEFWIARDKCLTIGFKMEGDWDSWLEDSKDVKEEILPYEFRPQMGVRVFF